LELISLEQMIADKKQEQYMRKLNRGRDFVLKNIDESWQYNNIKQ